VTKVPDLIAEPKCSFDFTAKRKVSVDCVGRASSQNQLQSSEVSETSSF